MIIYFYIPGSLRETGRFLVGLMLFIAIVAIAKSMT